jgi:hypothetical protein
MGNVLWSSTPEPLSEEQLTELKGSLESMEKKIRSLDEQLDKLTESKSNVQDLLAVVLQRCVGDGNKYSHKDKNLIRRYVDKMKKIDRDENSIKDEHNMLELQLEGYRGMLNFHIRYSESVEINKTFKKFDIFDTHKSELLTTELTKQHDIVLNNLKAAQGLQHDFTRQKEQNEQKRRFEASKSHQSSDSRSIEDILENSYVKEIMQEMKLDTHPTSMVASTLSLPISQSLTEEQATALGD